VYREDKALNAGQRTRWLQRGAIAAAVLAFASVAHVVYSTVPVTVEGRPVVARAGQSFAEVVEKHASILPGDLVSAADSRIVLQERAGEPPVVLVDGEAVPASATVSAGDSIVAFPGADAVEPLVTETLTVEAQPRTIGKGTVEKVLVPGTPGIEQLTVGAISRSVIATDVVVDPEPGLVRLVPEGRKVVALTFDDGPWPKHTEAVLKILEDRDVPATFFMVGLRVKRSPGLAREVAEAGHAIGNHTYGHRNLADATAKDVRTTVGGANRMIRRATGVTPVWFRAPWGQLSADGRKELKRMKMRPALWTVDPQDWRPGMTADEIARATIKAARPGAVILLHDGGGDRTQTVKALPKIIDGLRARGYEFVTLEEMERVRSSW
jgi:peptidoglycan/xylan/chitin deacetylase (PgdA/CDA1 family)